MPQAGGEGAGKNRTSLAGWVMQQWGHPVLEPCLPSTYSLPSPSGWAQVFLSHCRERGGGHRDARLAQLVWLVLASWQGRALGTGEDVAGSTWEDGKTRVPGDPTLPYPPRRLAGPCVSQPQGPGT